MTHSPLLQAGAGAHRGEIRAGRRLGEPLAEPDLAGQQPGQVARLLLVGAPAKQRVAEHLQAGRLERLAPEGQPGPGELLDEHDLVQLGKPAAAVLDRPGDAEQSAPVQDRAPAGYEVLGRRLGPDRADAAPVRGQLFRQDLADLGPERLRLGGVSHVHGGSQSSSGYQIISYIITIP